MQLITLPRFERELARLSVSQKLRVVDALDIFRVDPLAQKLRNHPLKGNLSGLRSISAGYDLRIVFRLKDGHYEIVSLVSVGTHGRAYRGR